MSNVEDDHRKYYTDKYERDFEVIDVVLKPIVILVETVKSIISKLCNTK